MKTFYDYDIEHPFSVTGEKQTIKDGKIRLDYIPQVGTVSISGFTESSSTDVSGNKFFIDYSATSRYRMATGFVTFDTSHNGREVTINYKGVSTLVLAKHMNEIKSFMENFRNEIDSRIKSVVGTAPASLDTLQELADALGDDPNFATTITNKFNAKLNTSGGTITGALTVSGALTAKGGITGNITGNVTGSSGTSTVAAKVGNSGAVSKPMVFNWASKNEAPKYLWGGADGTNMYVYTPSLLNVNYANSAGAVSWQNVSGKPATYPPNAHMHDEYVKKNGNTYTFVGNVSGSAASATNDSKGNNIANTYLPLSGGIMTGTLSMSREQFAVGSKPDKSIYSGAYKALDKNGKNLAWFSNVVTTDGINKVHIRAYENITSNDKFATFELIAEPGYHYGTIGTPKTEDNSNKIATTKFVRAVVPTLNAKTASNVAWSGVTGKPTTIGGYGITDAPTKTGGGASGTWGININGNAASATKDSKGNVIADTYLSKSGGVITGGLTIKHTGIADKATKPEKQTYREIAFCVNSGTAIVDRYAILSSGVRADGVTFLKMMAYKFEKGSDQFGGSLAIYNNNGTAYATAPTPAIDDDSDKIATTGWVRDVVPKLKSGDSAKCCGFTLGCNVPANAKFTDTNTTYKAFGGATASAAGGTGLVPAPGKGEQTYFLCGNGNWVKPTNTYSAFGAATADAAGKAGLVPAPAKGEQGLFLCGNGKWAKPANTTYKAFGGATASAAGGTGLVPAPAKGAQEYLLKGDATWVAPSGLSVKYATSAGSAKTATTATTAGTCTGNAKTATTATTANNIPTVAGKGNIWIA